MKIISKSLLVLILLLSGLTLGSASVVASSGESLRVESMPLIPKETSVYRVLTKEEFIQRKAEITGKSDNNIRSEVSSNSGIQSEPVETEFREYYFFVDIDDHKRAKAGVLTEVAKFTFGQSVYYRFSAIYEDTIYLIADSQGTYEIKKNYAIATFKDDSNLILAVSGYAETAVTYSKLHGLSISKKMTYYRDHFDAVSISITLK